MEKQEDMLCSEIRKAMQNRELKVYYQPQYNSLTNKLTSAEALVRWQKPDGTIVMPGSFIPQLEKNGAILELDWYMLEEVCIFLKHQKEEGIHSVPVAVNFSRLHVDEKGFTRRLCEIVDRYEIPHKMIEVEVTESAFVEQSEKIIDLIRQIRKEGFSVAIDDFGSGLSSLSFVKDAPVDILKLDRSLFSSNCEDEKERIVLESIFIFAHRLKLTTVAEGVETKEQLGFLRTCDCKIIQGFLYAKPMPEKDFWEVCQEDAKISDEDILFVQAASSANELLMEAIFMEYPMVLLANLTRNSFYMMAYENFTSKKCPSTGVFEEVIRCGASTMHPEDQQLFYHTFCIKNQLEAYHRGEKTIRLVTRQKGDDGVYRRVETTNYFVKNPSSEDVLVISLNHNLD